jgi:hypothetical protein
MASTPLAIHQFIARDHTRAARAPADRYADPARRIGARRIGAGLRS